MECCRKTKCTEVREEHWDAVRDLFIQLRKSKRERGSRCRKDLVPTSAVAVQSIIVDGHAVNHGCNIIVK